MRGSTAWCHVRRQGGQTGWGLMTGRLYVNTASNEIIGDLGIIIMNRMGTRRGGGVRSQGKY